MKTADTVYYAGQGYIYRCPHCQAPERGGDGKSGRCRTCGKEFQLKELNSMNEGLYSVIRDINRLETGTSLGMSREMLQESNVGRAARAAGLDIEDFLDSGSSGRKKRKPSTIKPTAFNIEPFLRPDREGGDPWSRYRLKLEQLNQIQNSGDQGKRLIKFLAAGFKLTVDELLTSKQTTPLEYIREAKCKMLMEDHPGLSNEEKIELLNANGFDENGIRDGRVYVFFGSTVMPECDFYVDW